MAVDFFLKVDGADGESKATGHVNEIKIHSFSWGASQTTSVFGSGGSGAGKASLSDISIMKDLDKASSELFKMLLKGVHIASVVLTAQKSTGDTSGKPFLTITFNEVFVTSQQISGSSEIPMESVAFSYGKIKFDYSTQGTDGTLTSTGAVTYQIPENLVS
jgi:type VI secretion system secreted protein Hcp